MSSKGKRPCSAEVPVVSVCSPVVQQKFLWWVCAVLLLRRSSCGGCAESCCSAEVPVVNNTESDRQIFVLCMIFSMHCDLLTKMV